MQRKQNDQEIEYRNIPKPNLGYCSQSINVLPKTLTKLVEILPNIKSLNNVIISENRIKNKQKHIVLKSIVLINLTLVFNPQLLPF